MTELRCFLRGDIDIFSAPALRHELTEAVESGEDLAIDCTGVTFMDSTGIALLMAAQSKLQARGRTLRIVNASRTTIRVIDILGLSEKLHIDAEYGSTANS